ncbi:MAG TPA: hypothetical protein VM166_03780 [Gemmatimonadaceae bacterium]|nr:hypothetical protein [Gemmatimonadaceae bacterium]
MSEEKFEEFLRKAAQSYNAPPARAPRDEMWTAIQAQRANKPRVVYGGASSVAAVARHRFGSKVWLGAAAAALMLVATGVGIGRWSAKPVANSPVVDAPPRAVATTLPETPAAESPAAETPIPQSAPGHPRSGTFNSGERGAQRANPEVRNSSRPGAPQVASVSCAIIRGCPESAPLTRLAPLPPQSTSSTSAYQIAAMHHLSDAEALLTSFRTRSAADQQMDAQLASWARDLLSNTRLLLDSPVASDPQRRPLLEDLELVLVQIVQLSPGSTQQDRELIEKTLQQDHVLTRLRTAIPAGAQRGS